MNDRNFTKLDAHPSRSIGRSKQWRRLIMDLAAKIGANFPSPDDLDQTQGHLMKTWNSAPEHVRYSVPSTSFTLHFSRLCSTTLHLATFIGHGANIFLLEKNLLEALRHTALRDVRPSDLKLPYKCFFIAFGHNYKRKMPGKEAWIDGVYIMVIEDRWQFIVTARSETPNESSRGWLIDPEPYFYAPLQVKSSETTFGELLADAVNTGDVDTRGNHAIDDDEFKQAHQFAEDYGIEIQRPKKSAMQENAEFNKIALDGAQEAMAIALNALCYMSSTEMEDETTKEDAFPIDAPKNLVIKAQIALSQSARKKAISKMMNLGVIPFKRLSIASKEREASAASLVEHGDKATHWRRGHWRRQPTGQGRSIVVLKWIRPTLVRGDKGLPNGGRIYSVE